MELLTIIIPTYQGADSLPVALESICRQSYKKIEVIVSDDNGPGTPGQLETAKIIEHYQSKLDLVYLINEHVNGSHARNEGLKRAKGAYVSFLDDDDFYLPHYAERLAEAFVKNADADLLFFDVLVLTKEGSGRIVSNEAISARDLLFMKKEIGSGSNICFRKKIFDESGGFEEKYFRLQDIEFIVKKLNRYRSLWINDLEVVKYYNTTDNYLNYQKSLEHYKFLRDDCVSQEIITEQEAEELFGIQLHSLYNDSLVKNSPYKDIRTLSNLMKDRGVLTTQDKCLRSVYRISPSLFNLIFRTYMRMKKKKPVIANIREMLAYRKELESAKQ